MDIQSILTIAIEVVFWAFTGLIIFDFINGLFVLDINPITVVSDLQPQVKQETMPAVTPAPQIELPIDPWELNAETQQVSVKTSSVVPPFSELKLLPQAKQVEQKSKRNSTSKKTTSAAKTTSTKTPQKQGRTRKQAA
ncbi:hypothetical protein [Halotia branconii]|uniref:Uncharacterized protein n=1 Tax=Halotia branconii CENA392 TaxID=1539056 RepID=A0AAJ6NYE6_9CYAN|nr:hypothetical protein [Halotia branconii]WGV29038.1 hypothetical protein QI031_31255 [Halotia branconii CENA392]